LPKYFAITLSRLALAFSLSFIFCLSAASFYNFDSGGCLPPDTCATKSRVNFARASEAQFIGGEAGNPCKRGVRSLV